MKINNKHNFFLNVNKQQAKKNLDINIKYTIFVVTFLSPS